MDRLASVMYPVAAHVHYAVINRRDQAVLAQAGIPVDYLDVLPTPVAWPAAVSAMSTRTIQTAPLVLYPTRAIRRKNIGEFLLWAALDQDARRYAITLTPEDPIEQPAYRQWVTLAEVLNLPVAFEAGRQSKLSFPDLIRSAEMIMTTSVAEGFGLAFLEPWLLERPVFGRNLPDITDQFEEAGVNLSSLYSQLWIPVTWIDRRALLERIRIKRIEMMAAYQCEPSPGDAETCLTAAMHETHIDFGRLDEEAQQTVIRAVVADPSRRTMLLPNQLMSASEQTVPIQRNRTIIRQEFGLERYRQRLLAIYRRVLDAPSEQPWGAARVQTLLDFYLAPERFFLLRS